MKRGEPEEVIFFMHRFSDSPASGTGVAGLRTVHIQFIRDAVEKAIKEKTDELSKSGIDDYDVEVSLLAPNRTLDRDEKQQRDCKEFMDRTERRIGVYMSEGADVEITKLLLKLKKDLNDMPDSYWTRQLRKDWMKKYAGWVGDLPVTDKPKLTADKSKPNGKEDRSERISMRPSDFEPDEA